MNASVHIWNEELALNLLPNNLILILYMIIGFFGNGCVIFTYLCSKLWKEEERYFIPYLSAADLFACLVCASFGIVLNLNQATLDDSVLCKTWWFFAGFTTFLSTFYLVVIAFQRLTKLCSSNHNVAMDLSRRRLTAIVLTVVSLFLSLPMPYFYGSVPFSDVRRNLTGQRCSRLYDVNRTFSLMYGSVLVVVAQAIITSLSVMYFKIGYVVRVHLKTLKCNSSSATRNQNIVIKLSLMFMLITVIFLICYIPKVIIMLLEANSPMFWEELSDDTRPIALFIYRMFIINNIANPFIYTFFDKAFLFYMKTLLCC